MNQRMLFKSMKSMALLVLLRDSKVRDDLYGDFKSLSCMAYN